MAITGSIFRGATAPLRRVGPLCRVAAAVIMSVATAAGAQEALPPWTKGYLYIHHISTGRGNSAYLVMPDGTVVERITLHGAERFAAAIILAS